MVREPGRPPRLLVCARQLPHNSEGFRVARLLREAGCDVAVSEDGAADPAGCDAVLLLGNALWFPAMAARLAAAPAGGRPRTIVWHWEPLPPPRASGLRGPRLTLRDLAKRLLRDRRANDAYLSSRLLVSLARAGAIDTLFVSTPSRVEHLAEHGVPADWLPLGYDAEHGRDLGGARDLDVLFLGERRLARRWRILRQLRRRGVPVEARGDWHDPSLWGEARTRLLNRTKIFLNVHRFAGEFSGLRLILGMANGCLVVSEPMYRPEPFVEGEHFVSAAPERMSEVVRHYLRHDDERQRIARAGRDFVTTRLRLETSVERVCAAIGRREAA